MTAEACASTDGEVEINGQDLQEKSAEELLEIVRVDGGELVVGNSDVAQSLVACGFEITRQSSDGTEFVLEVREENYDEERPLPVEVAMEFAEEELDNFKSKPVVDTLNHPAHTLGREFSIKSPESGSEWKRSVQPSVDEEPIAQDVYAVLYVRPAYLRDAAQVEVTLILDNALFGVQNCLQTAHCLGHFIHRLEISASPSDAWKSECTLRTVRPGDDHDMKPVQHTDARGWNAGITMSGPVPGGQMTRTSSLSTSYSQVPHGWLPASRNPLEKSVTWTWKMNTWQGGQPFLHEAKSSWVLPKLPFHDPGQINFPDLNCEATWTVSTAKADALKNAFEWRFVVRVHTALVKPMLSLRYGRDLLLLRRKPDIRSDPFEFFTVGTSEFP